MYYEQEKSGVKISQTMVEKYKEDTGMLRLIQVVDGKVIEGETNYKEIYQQANGWKLARE